MENVGGGIGQNPATEVTHVGLNQLPVFPVHMYLFSLRKLFCDFLTNHKKLLLPSAVYKQPGLSIYIAHSLSVGAHARGNLQCDGVIGLKIWLSKLSLIGVMGLFSYTSKSLQLLLS